MSDVHQFSANVGEREKADGQAGAMRRCMRTAIIICISVIVGVSLSGCPPEGYTDYGTDVSCECAADPMLNLTVPNGLGITSIEVPGVFGRTGYPGQIMRLEVTGGHDVDKMIDGVMPPLEACPECVDSSSCQAIYGNPSRVCVSSYDNRNMPFNWSIPMDYVAAYETYDQGDTSVCYLELKKDLELTEQAHFGITVIRLGATADECSPDLPQPDPNSCDNLTYVTFDVFVNPTLNKFVLSAITNPGAQSIELTCLAREGSQKLREDKSEDFMTDPSLQARYIDTRDVSVNADYAVPYVDTADQIGGYPLGTNWTESGNYEGLLMAALTGGYDIIVTDHIYSYGYPESGDSTVYGLSYNIFQLIILSSVEGQGCQQHSLFHEIGHMNNLADNQVLDPNWDPLNTPPPQPACPYNIMVNGMGIGANVQKGLDCNPAQAHAMEVGLNRWRY